MSHRGKVGGKVGGKLRGWQGISGPFFGLRLSFQPFPPITVGMEQKPTLKNDPNLPKVAILGRPNVGKSTLFNLLTKPEGRRHERRMRGNGLTGKAITHATAGTTRDVRQTPGRFFNLGFMLLDTAGVEEGKGAAASGLHGGQRTADDAPLQKKLNELALGAAAAAQVLVLVLDGGAGLLPADRSLAQKLRKMDKPVVLVVNKVDLKTAQTTLEEAETLGFGVPVAFSAAHGLGAEDLYAALSPYLPVVEDDDEEDGEENEENAPAGAELKSGGTKIQEKSDIQRPNARQTAAEKGAEEASGKVAGEAEAAANPEEAGEEQEEGSFTAPAPVGHAKGTDVEQDVDADDENQLQQPETLPPPRIAILGRPNVGKSTLVNALVGSERMLTGPVAGLTREAIAHTFSYDNHEFTIVDTPGLRRKGKVDKEGLEFLSVGQSLQAVENADIIILVIDASTHNIEAGQWRIFEQQDAQIAAMILNQFKPLIIALNKWDAVKDKPACLADVEIQLRHRLHGIHQPLAMPISAQRNKGLDGLVKAVSDVWKASHSTFSTGKLNNLLNKTLAKRSPPLANGKVVSLKFIRQTGINPPVFTFWGNRIDQVSESYKQFLRNQLAATLGLQNLPVRIYFRANKNPFSSRK